MKKSVVILDNCSIHHDEELRQIIVEECGGWYSAFDEGFCIFLINRRSAGVLTTILA
jgi:hypothetical protein